MVWKMLVYRACSAPDTWGGPTGDPVTFSISLLPMSGMRASRDFNSVSSAQIVPPRLWRSYPDGLDYVDIWQANLISRLNFLRLSWKPRSYPDFLSAIDTVPCFTGGHIWSTLLP